MKITDEKVHFLYSCTLLAFKFTKKMWWLPFADILQNRSSYKFGDIHSKTPVLESLFSKVQDLQLY